MKFLKLILVVALMFTLANSFAYKAEESNEMTKKLDLYKYHNVGNIWLRVSNYGFFGAGDDVEKPSLEYPGGSGIDYLYQGALWFGAKKYRKTDVTNKQLYWETNPATATEAPEQTIEPTQWPIVDTLTTVGFDGDADLYEFLPAYNQLEMSAIDGYDMESIQDTMLMETIREQRRGRDDDGDGKIDEDPAGYSFPLRDLEGLEEFSQYGGDFIHNITNWGAIENNINIWYPRGFVDLSDDQLASYNFAKPRDDDNDGKIDEDGAPVSEQDFVSYYYDYSPFGTSGDRDWGSSKNSQTHNALNVRVRQMSYQWSYDFIKNLCYVEFNITNMNESDTLFDCAMGIYIDADVGPQSWGGSEIAGDDVSSYVTGSEFAYTYDDDQDGGLTDGFIGARVCTPDPEQLVFECWTWSVGNGPEDKAPLDFLPSGFTNEKYALLTGINPVPNDYTSLRDNPDTQIGDPVDTRFLFSFFGDQKAFDEDGATENTWNLLPKNTMKIVIALFPGKSLNELIGQADWAKEIYGQAQTLENVVKPDIYLHYESPEPPTIPNTFIEKYNDGSGFTVYWDNRSEFSYDLKTVLAGEIGWDPDATTADLDACDLNYDPEIFPEEYDPALEDYINVNAVVNPLTADYLRQDFQGYRVYGRSGSGLYEDWQMIGNWDKVETDIELERFYQDYVDSTGTIETKYYGGYLGNDTNFPQEHDADAEDTNYYKLDSYFEFVPYVEGEKICGYPLYSSEVVYSDDIAAQSDEIDALNITLSEKQRKKALLFMNEDLVGQEDLYFALFDKRMIPLPGMASDLAISDLEFREELRKERLARRYYSKEIVNVPRGTEYYVSVTAFDRGIPDKNVLLIESGQDGNMRTFFPGPVADESMDNIYVVPNPYKGGGFDGRRQNDDKGDRSKRIWFVNLPEKCNIRIYTLAGDLVDKIEHRGEANEDIISLSKAQAQAETSSGIHSWDLLSKYNQIIAPGVYLYSVENLENDDKKVGKFVLIK